MSSMSYAQFGYTYPSSSPLLMSSHAASCCEAGRPIMSDPHTGQAVCSCQYEGRVAGLVPPRVGEMSLSSVYGSPYAGQGYIAAFGADPSAFYSPLGNPFEAMKEGAEAWRANLQQPTAYYPYDPTLAGGAPYPYGSYAAMDGARRKNATRETTATLKAWLMEHRKNPYPTKGEKIMLAIITKMTLTQVSTWFANARRRLKKENKMTWSPRNRCGEDGRREDGSDNEDDDDDEDRKDREGNSDDDNHGGLEGDRDNKELDVGNPCEESRQEDNTSGSVSDYRPPPQSSSPADSLGSISAAPRPASPEPSPAANSVPVPPIPSENKPKIWSLADTATCSSPAPRPDIVKTTLQGPVHMQFSHHRPFDSAVTNLRQWVDGVFHRPIGSLPSGPMGPLPVASQASASATVSGMHPGSTPHTTPPGFVSSQERTPALPIALRTHASPAKDEPCRTAIDLGCEADQPIRTAFKPVQKR